MLSFAVTAFEEMGDAGRQGENICRCIQAAEKHEAVGEIIVMDDGSRDWRKLWAHLGATWNPKLTVYHNPQNRGVFVNKIEAIALATHDWVITCDSDNVMGDGFINEIVLAEKQPNTWLCPSFARPKFDYRALVGQYNLKNIGQMLGRLMAECCMNTGNQTVHRDTFLAVFGKYRCTRADLMMSNWLDIPAADRSSNYWRLVFDACDSFILNMEWLLAGKSIRVVDGLEYDHHYSGGPDSNYARAPKEKERLSEILLTELRGKSTDAR